MKMSDNDIQRTIIPDKKDLKGYYDNIISDNYIRIMNSETDVVYAGNAYYVSNTGDDMNDGKSPDHPWKTVKHVSEAELKPGDAVFFHRNGIFRGVLVAKEGVTYSAYGDGEKPVITPSPLLDNVWYKTDVENIYQFGGNIEDDVGAVYDEEGHIYVKATVNFDSGINLTNGKHFESWRDLNDEGMFYHDLGGPYLKAQNGYGQIYLYSTKDLSKETHSLSFNVRTNAVNVRGNNVHINNLRIKNCGCHGIGAGSAAGLHVDYCVIDQIGGSVQYYRGGRPVRFGNGIEIYGSAVDYTADHNILDDIYDAGITHQYSAGGDAEIVMENILYRDNVILNCSYGVEYFCGVSDSGVKRYMKNVQICHNSFGGYKSDYIGSSRPDKGVEAHIKSWDHVNEGSEIHIYDNVFMPSENYLIHIAAENEEWLPEIANNTFIQSYDGLFGRFGKIPTSAVRYNDEELPELGDIVKDNAFFGTD